MQPIYEQLHDKAGFSPAQKIILSLIQNKKKILEVGSSSGYMTKVLKDRGCSVDVVELDTTALKKVKNIANLTFAGSIEDKKIQDQIKKHYEVIICADVLEHLADPEPVLDFLKTRLDDKGYFLISIPNVAFWEMRKQLFFQGDFSYKESGLMDKTHLRFYSLNNFIDLLKKHKFYIYEMIPAEARFPFEYSISNIPLFGNLFLKFFKSKIIRLWPNLTYYHYVVKASIKKS